VFSLPVVTVAAAVMYSLHRRCRGGRENDVLWKLIRSQIPCYTCLHAGTLFIHCMSPNGPDAPLHLGKKRLCVICCMTVFRY
jgi:hypothetical protein